MGISVNSIHDETVLNKRRIARSTVLLYVRMLVTVCVGLYTGRIVLNALGISDYGIYNVVGSIVMMLSSFNAAMTAASQRFMAYELGRADAEKLRSVFYTSVNIHIVIALAVFLLSETVGLWFVNTHLNIDAGRMTAANWVYQFSILTFMITVMSVPYNSCIVAHERMGVFASVSIFESILKLGTAICIASASVDRLVLYGGLLLFVSVLCNGCYVIYCKRYFAECAGRKKNNRSLFKKMFLFAGWSTVGNLGFTFKDQIQNILLNVFFGSAINAARGIAGQIFGITSSFVSNFSMAINPQITKQYAKGNRYDYQYLVYDGARYSFCLLLLIAVPLLINTDYVLELWLGNVPPYTDRFVTLLLFAILLHTLSGTVTAAIQATGKVKLFQTGICMLMLSEMPAAWLMLKSGFPPYAVIYPTLTSYTAAIFFRFYVWRRIVPVVELRTYLSQVILRCLILFAVSYAVCGWIKGMFGDGFVAFAVTTLLSLCIVSFMIYILGLKRHERVAICREIRNRKFFPKYR